MNVKIKHILCAVLLFCAYTTTHAMNYISPQSPEIGYMGRFNTTNSEEFTCSFPASSIFLYSNSKKVTVQLLDYPMEEGRPNYIAIIVNDTVYKEFPLIPGQSEYTIANFSNEAFRMIQVCKRTESLIGTIGFKGFGIDKNATTKPVQLPGKKILFIGNSITCGYGNEATNATDSFTAHTENAYMSYAAIAARELNAQYHLIAYSGKGIYRNWADTVFDIETMPKVFHKTLAFDTCNSWNHTQYVPSLIVINLGTNDFSPPLGANKDLYITRFTEFLQTVSQLYANAPIVCVNSQMLQEPQRSDQITWIQESIAVLKNNSIFFCKLSMQGTVGYGADWHPNIAQNKVNAKELVGFCKEMGW
ncbi:MAG: Endoglucanase E precursor [Bacteroidetes bacterium ADurb.Bin217]|nr:MAG: Endoglucanase E precursor [Bacteroidetes bacterium ADurb.Bin217]